MPTTTYTPLANITLGTAASSITFGSIPATYRDLIVIFVGAGSTTLEGRIRLNGDTGANYEYQRLSGNGTTGSAAFATSQTSGFLSSIAQATTTSSLQMTINLCATNIARRKVIVSRADNAANGTDAIVNQYTGTVAAITSIQILTSTGNWAIGTTAALYGVIA